LPFSIEKSFYFCRVSKSAGMYLMDILEESVPDLVSARKNGFPPVFEGDVNHGDHIKMCDLENITSKYPEKFSKFNFDRSSLDAMKKFSVVRNPYERTLSLFSFMQRNIITKYTPQNFLEDLRDFRKWQGNYHIYQSDFVVGNDLELHVDRYFKVEDDFLTELADYLDVELKLKENTVNVTKNRMGETHEYFQNPEVIELIQKHFERDFSNFGYSIDDYPR
jgi:hypothetical protein